jgi:hypothetical protein
MIKSMFSDARLEVRRELERATLFGSLIVALLATLGSFAVVNTIFSYIVRVAFSGRDSRNLPHFSLPSGNWVFVLICIVSSMTAIRTKKWVLPLGAGFFAYAVILPMYAVEGPITRFLWLIDFHIELLGVALILNMLIAVFWIRESKRVRSDSNPILRMVASTEV